MLILQSHNPLLSIGTSAKTIVAPNGSLGYGGGRRGKAREPPENREKLKSIGLQ